MLDPIAAFILELKQQNNHSTVSNPYLDKAVSANLSIYLEAMLQVKGKRILLVGEAPGYLGCKITGIPFTSGEVFENIQHPVLDSIKDSIYLSKIESEQTAKIVWNYLAGKNNAPLFWNAFPYHPHYKDNENSNRPLKPIEIRQGVKFIQALNILYKPELIAGIGHAGVKSAQLAFPERHIEYIRHPSHGGKSDFIKGMDKIF